MSEVDQESNNTDESNGDEALDETTLTVDDYKKIVSKLRKEAGSRRLANKDLDAKLEEYEKWKLSQMSEVDRVKSEKEAVERELAGYRREKLQTVVAAKVGLDEEYADLIVGDSEDEMITHAKSLKARLKPSANQSVMRPGARGKPVGGESYESKDAWFADLWRKG